MSFLSVLGKIGKAVFTGAKVASPIISQFLPLGGTFAKVAAVVGVTERVGDVLVGSGTGAQKAAAALPLTADIIKASEIVAGKEIADEALFLQGVQKIQEGTHDVLKSLKAE